MSDKMGEVSRIIRVKVALKILAGYEIS